MNIERFRKIIKYSERNHADMEEKLDGFRADIGMGINKDVLNIMQIVRPALRKKGYLILEIPFADEEIGALCYRGDALGYILMNTSLPRVNMNFAVCHELYHVCYGDREFRTKAELSGESYFEQEEEYAANLFAGMLLMPEAGFRQMYQLFCRESEEEMDTVIRLMNYYQAPYMAVLIRCYELGLTNSHTVSERLLYADPEQIRKKLQELWLDDSILNATQKDDFKQIEMIVEQLGKEYVKESYINERTLKKVLQNMRTLYSEIKGD